MSSRKCAQSKDDLRRGLDEMQLGETRYFRYPDMRFPEIERCIRTYARALKKSFKVTADYEKGLGVTRVVGNLPRE